MEKIFNDADINRIANKVYARDRYATVWDVFVAMLSEKGNIEPFIIWILSDFPTIELVAKGYSIDYIANFLEMPIKEVEATCKTWGIRGFKVTLDFDPTSVYNKDMTIAEFKSKLEPVLAIVPSEETLEDIVLNVEKYWSVVELLEEWER